MTQLDERFADWVDGRLDPDDSERLQHDLRADRELRLVADRYRDTVALVRRALGAPERAPENLVEVVLEQVALPRGRLLAFAPWLGVAAAAGLTLWVALRDAPAPAASPDSSLASAPREAAETKLAKTDGDAEAEAGQARPPEQERPGQDDGVANEKDRLVRTRTREFAAGAARPAETAPPPASLSTPRDDPDPATVTAPSTPLLRVLHAELENRRDPRYLARLDRRLTGYSASAKNETALDGLTLPPDGHLVMLVTGTVRPADQREAKPEARYKALERGDFESATRGWLSAAEVVDDTTFGRKGQVAIDPATQLGAHLAAVEPGVRANAALQYIASPGDEVYTIRGATTELPGFVTRLQAYLQAQGQQIQLRWAPASEPLARALGAPAVEGKATGPERAGAAPAEPAQGVLLVVRPDRAPDRAKK